MFWCINVIIPNPRWLFWSGVVQSFLIVRNQVKKYKLMLNDNSGFWKVTYSAFTFLSYNLPIHFTRLELFLTSCLFIHGTEYFEGIALIYTHKHVLGWKLHFTYYSWTCQKGHFWWEATCIVKPHFEEWFVLIHIKSNLWWQCNMSWQATFSMEKGQPVKTCCTVCIG